MSDFEFGDLPPSNRRESEPRENDEEPRHLNSSRARHPQQNRKAVLIGIIVGAATITGIIVIIVIAQSGRSGQGSDSPAAALAPDGNLSEPIGSTPVVKPWDITKKDIGRKIVISGKVNSRTFEGSEGQQLLRGDKVMARMFVELHKEKGTEVVCQFRPSDNKNALPEIETIVRIVGIVDSVIINDKDKSVFLKECKFAK